MIKSIIQYKWSVLSCSRLFCVGFCCLLSLRDTAVAHQLTSFISGGHRDGVVENRGSDAYGETNETGKDYCIVNCVKKSNIYRENEKEKMKLFTVEYRER